MTEADEYEIDAYEAPADEKTAEPTERDPVDVLNEQLAAERQRVGSYAQQLADEKRRRAELEDAARQQGESRLASDKALLEHAIAAEQAKADAAEQALAAAYEAADFQAVAKRQREIARAEARLTTLNAGLEDADRISKEPRRPEAPPRQQQQPASREDQIEQHIQSYSPRTQEWLRRNRADVFSDARRGDMAYAGHIMATAAGLQPDTDDYFAYLDRHMGYSAADRGGGQSADAAPGEARRSNGRVPSAPPSRGAAGGQTQVRLTQVERETADDLGMTYAEYAQAKRAIQDGKANFRFKE